MFILKSNTHVNSQDFMTYLELNHKLRELENIKVQEIH